MGRRIKKAIQTTTIITISTCYLVIATSAYAADAPPDTFEIDTAAVATGLQEDGDWLIFARYNVAWALEASYPDDPLPEKVVVQLLDPDTDDVLASTAPFPYYNNGYDMGLVSIYMTPVEAASLEWEEQYIIRLVTLPDAFTSSDTYEYVLPANEYCNSGTASQNANRSWIRTYCLNTASALETNWGVSTALTQQSINMVLSEVGEAYYVRVAPGLQDLVPHLFLATDEVPDFTEETYTGTHARALVDQWGTDDNIVNAGKEGIGGIMGGDETFACNFLILGLMLAALLFAAFVLQAVAPGLLASALIMMAGVDLGFLEVAIMGILLFLFLLYSVNKTIRLNQA